MIKLADYLSKIELNDIAKYSVKIGDVYRIKMDNTNGITPKPGDEYRNKFFVVLGFDSEGNAYGGVIINSQINKYVPQSIQDWHMPVKCSKYHFLSHDSFVDCSKLKNVSLDKFGEWEFKGQMDEEDIQLIIATVKDSPNETPKKLAMYGLL
jgi:hypothetical protein